MKRLLCALVALSLGSAVLRAAEAEAAASTSAADLKTAAAAAVTVRPPVQTPDFMEHLVDSVLLAFDVRASGNTATHYVICVVLLVVALLARRIVTALLFPLLKRLAAKTETTLDDKLFPALEGPVAAFVMMVGLFTALRVLKLSPESDTYIGHGSQVAFSLVVFWGLWRALATLLDHASEVTQKKGSGLAAFMPWIKKALLTVFVVVGVLLTIQGLGYDVKAILAGLGIGGLAFALAAQDTLANIFGAIVVAVDQPFRVGESVRIGSNVGAVEDIGLRSTRIRLLDKSLMTIPNKTVAAETITNLSRFTRRRFEQVLGLTYDTPPAELEAILGEIRGIVTAQPEVDAKGVLLFFRDFGPSSLDLWLVYEVLTSDMPRALAVKQQVNLAIMRAVAARGLSFAFPTQTVHLAKEKQG
ncbi:MAG: mechanosensitive ion channel family protein [Opitutaceae bacterium]|nr:mechanosensitive ion channel family protein [Opitutaceae bacterium]